MNRQVYALFVETSNNQLEIWYRNDLSDLVDCFDNTWMDVDQCTFYIVPVLTPVDDGLIHEEYEMEQLEYITMEKSMTEFEEDPDITDEQFQKLERDYINIHGKVYIQNRDIDLPFESDLLPDSDISSELWFCSSNQCFQNYESENCRSVPIL